jgi:hypothetical protein
VIEIRSYRRVFDLERRIYRVDRLRLNPGGIPVRGLVYFLALAATTALLSRGPLVAVLANALPWYLRDVAIPAAGAALLTVIRIEGRPFHLAMRALIRYRSAPRHLVGTRPCPARAHTRRGECWVPGEILILPDGSDCTARRRVRYTGPGAVLVGVAHERVPSRFRALKIICRRADLTVRPLPGVRVPGRREVIVLERGARLDLR